MKTKMQKLSVTAMALIIAILMSSQAIGQSGMAKDTNTSDKFNEPSGDEFSSVKDEEFNAVSDDEFSSAGANEFSQNFEEEWPVTGVQCYCINTIPDLTEKQENKIENLREKHFKEINSLRNKRRAALNWEKKEKTGIQIAKARIDHRKEIRSVLNEEQQEYFDQYLNSARFGKRGHGRGWGRGRGCGRGRGRGYGRDWHRGAGYRMGNCPWR